MTLLQCCTGCETTSGVVFAMMTSLVLVTPLASQGVEPVHLLSETCYGSGNCSLHTLDCGAGARLAVLEATYGFKPQDVYNDCDIGLATGTCSPRCCSYNSSSDCKEDFTADNQERVQAECSRNRTCQIRAQRGDNTVCSSNATRASTSTFSTLKAVCVPDAVTFDPCANVTVTGNLVSLYLDHPPPANSCSCRVDINDTTSDTANLQTTAYDVQASAGSDWSVTVVTGGGGEGEGDVSVMNYSGAARQFPAASVSSSSTSSLRVEFAFHDLLASSPQRVWLGFRGEGIPVTLRCGQDARDYEQSLTTSTSTSTTTTTTTRTTTTPQIVDSATAKGGNNASLAGGGGGGGGSSGGLDTTDIIVYAAVGVASLIVVSFVYVCVRKVRKKGCPSWCPPPCKDLECGKHDEERSSGQGSSPSIVATSNLAKIAESTAKTNGTVVGGGVSNGHVVHDVDETDNGHPFTQRHLSPFDHKRPRGSLHSLRRPSFGDLENITETEEESRFSTHHNPSHLNLAEQEEIFRLVDSKLAPLALDQEDDDNDDDDENENEEEEREESHADSHPPVKFHVGGGSVSSETDLENCLTKL